MKIPEIKKDLRKKLRNTINEVANRSEEIMHDEIEGFYAGGTPVYYKRTGTLGTTPQITDKYCNSNEAGVTASLNQNISYNIKVRISKEPKIAKRTIGRLKRMLIK